MANVEAPLGLSKAKCKLFGYLFGYPPMQDLYKTHQTKILGLLQEENADGLIAYVLQNLREDEFADYKKYFIKLSDEEDQELDFKTVVKELTKSENRLLVDTLRDANINFANQAIYIPEVGRKFIQSAKVDEKACIMQLELGELLLVSGLDTNVPVAEFQKPTKLTVRNFIDGRNWPHQVHVDYRPGYNKTSTEASVNDFLPPGDYLVQYQKAPSPATQEGKIFFQPRNAPSYPSYQFQVRKSEKLGYVLEKRKVLPLVSEKVPINNLELVHHINTPVNVAKITMVLSPVDPQEQRLKIFEEIAARTTRLVELIKADEAFFTALVEYAISRQAEQPRDDIKVPELPVGVRTVLDEIVSLSADCDESCSSDELLLQCALNINRDLHLVAASQEPANDAGSKYTPEDISQFFAAMALLQDAFEHIGAMRNKDLIMYYGNTGCGKSTSINYYSGIPLNVIVNKYQDKAIAIDIPALIEKAAKSNLDANKILCATIGHKIASSETIYAQSFPLVFPPRKTQNFDLFFCDTPGFKDTRGKNYDLAGRLSVDQAIKGAKSIRAIVLVLPYHAFEFDRGAGPVDLFGELRYQVPSLFSDPKCPHRKAIFLLISKHFGVKNAKERVIERIKGSLKEAQDNLTNLAPISIGQANFIAERVQIWTFLYEICTENRLQCIDIENQLERKSFLDDCLASPGIPSDYFVPPMDFTQTQVHLNNTLEVATYKWRTKIFETFLQVIPLEVAQAKGSIANLETVSKIRAADRVSIENTIAACKEQIAKFERRVSDLEEKKEGGDEAKEEIKRLHSDRLAAFNKDNEELNTQIQNTSQELKEVSEQTATLALHISELTALLKEKDDEYQAKRRKSTPILLWPKRPNYEPDNDLHLISWKSLTVRQQVINEVRSGRPEDFDQTSRKLVKCSDYTGCLYEVAHIAAEYRVVPDNLEERKEFLERVQNKALPRKTLYDAVIEGEFYKIDQEPKALATGKEIAYGFKTMWKAGRSLPWVKIHHQIPNQELHAARLLNLDGDMEDIRAQIETQEKKLRRAKEEQKRYENRLQRLQIDQQNLEASKESFLVQALDAAMHSLVNEYKAGVKAENARMQAQQMQLLGLDQQEQELLVSKSLLLQSIEVLMRRKRQLALLISNQLPVINLLVHLSTMFSQNNLPSQNNPMFEARDTAQLYSACFDFRNYYYDHFPRMKREIEAEFGFTIAGKIFLREKIQLPKLTTAVRSRPNATTRAQPNDDAQNNVADAKIANSDDVTLGHSAIETAKPADISPNVQPSAASESDGSSQSVRQMIKPSESLMGTAEEPSESSDHVPQVVRQTEAAKEDDNTQSSEEQNSAPTATATTVSANEAVVASDALHTPALSSAQDTAPTVDPVDAQNAEPALAQNAVPKGKQNLSEAQNIPTAELRDAFAVQGATTMEEDSKLSEVADSEELVGPTQPHLPEGSLTDWYSRNFCQVLSEQPDMEAEPSEAGDNRSSPSDVPQDSPDSTE